MKKYFIPLLAVTTAMFAYAPIMGRRVSDASPVICAVRGWPAKMPARSRIVVPELPQSRVWAGERSRPNPRPITVMALVAPSPVAEMSAPTNCRQFSVDRQSAPGA